MDDKVNILIVDDLPDKLLSLGAILESLGQNVVTAQSGREALRRLLAQEFAVILLDIEMPEMDGFETARLIRRRKRSEHTPIIFVTGFDDNALISQGYALGAVDYILSPVVPDVLRTKVGVFVDLYLKGEQLKRQAEERVALVREQAARAAAEEANRRAAFLAEASSVLNNSLDYGETRRDLLRLTVPGLADLAALTLATGDGQPWRSELAWVHPLDPDVQTRTVAEADAPHDALRAAHDRVLATGVAEVHNGLNASFPPGGGARDVLESVAVVPLRARGRTLGVLVLGSTDRRAAPDVALAEDLAGRAAVALDNARLYRDIQENDRRKSEFLAMLGHELRNPLAPIRNAVEYLRRQGLNDPDLCTARDTIDRQVKLMVRLVDDLLDVARITRGQIQLRTEPVDMAQVAVQAVETSRPLIDARRHALTVDLADEPAWVEGDPTRLAQVIANLLNNAAKYTEPGGRITLRVERQGPSVVTKVFDTGVGLPPEMLASVFDLFTQVERSLDRSQGGLGIGLTLVRRLVELHRGEVSASSEGPGRGSEFTVRLPACAQPAAPAGSCLTPRTTTARRILVVDDNVDAADSLGRLLQLLGHEISLAHDGPAALRAFAASVPEVVFLDIGLPGLDGYEVARRLRRTPVGAHTLLVALTGYGQHEDRALAQAAGFDHHMVKPVDPTLIENLLAAGPDGRCQVSAVGTLNQC
jgi:signal transduction histidine kinase